MNELKTFFQMLGLNTEWLIAMGAKIGLNEMYSLLIPIILFIVIIDCLTIIYLRNRKRKIGRQDWKLLSALPEIDISYLAF